MISSGQNIFKKVASSDRKQLLNQLCEESIVLLLKMSDNTVINLLPRKITPDHHLICSFPSEFNVLDSDETLLSFHIGTERYFFESTLIREGETVRLVPLEDLYILQRRASSRIIVPEAYPGFYEFQIESHKNAAFKGKIMDFSAGGLKMRIETIDPIFKEDDLVEGVLMFNQRRPIAMPGKVRASRVMPSAELQIVSLQFLNIDQAMEGKLLGLVMSVQQEIFSKFSTRKPGT